MMANEIGEEEVIRFIRNMSGHEHAGFIYSREATKDTMLSQFFDPPASSGAPMALISLHDNDKFDCIQIMTYDKLRVEEKSKALDKSSGGSGRYTNQTGLEEKQGCLERTPHGF